MPPASGEGGERGAEPVLRKLAFPEGESGHQGGEGKGMVAAKGEAMEVEDDGEEAKKKEEKPEEAAASAEAVKKEEEEAGECEEPPMKRTRSEARAERPALGVQPMAVEA
eukprot:666312-Rhodomonas_salina.1